MEGIKKEFLETYFAGIMWEAFMKIRTGFVSNSSSSSFVIRGVELPKTLVAERLGIKVELNEDEDKGDFLDALTEEIGIKLSSWKDYELTSEDTRDFFDGEVTSTIIVGCHLVHLEDGCATQLPEANDEKIIEVIQKKLGLTAEEIGQLHTFVQYIGNDNY